MNIFSYYANPNHFLRLAAWIQPIALAVMVICGAFGLYYGLYDSPPDYQQKETVRIMYLHVPAAWMGLAVYAFMAGASLISFVWRHRLADYAARSAAPIGACFTLICLITGSFWGKPTWGTWWIWDARLTSMFILFLLYLGYSAVWRMIEDEHKAAKIAALVCLVGAVDLPIIKYSVEWWNTLHQGASVFKAGGPSIHASMLLPLGLMAVAYKGLWIWLLMLRMKTFIFNAKYQRLLREHLHKTQGEAL